MVIAVHYHLMSRFSYISGSICRPPAWIAAMLSCALFLAQLSPAIAASEGPFSAGSCSDIGGGDVAWNPQNLAAKVAVDANKNKPDSNILRCTNFGFAVPPGAIINGIIVTVHGDAKKDDTVTDLRVRLVKAGVAGATDRSTTDLWPEKEAPLVRGGSFDLWGDTWTSADFNLATFGVEVAVQGVPGSKKEDVHIHDLTITIVHDANLTCGTIPPDYPIYAAGGLHSHNDWTINGNNISGSGNALQPDGVLTTVSQTLPAIFPLTFPPNSSTTDINTNATNPVAAGSYDTVTMNANTSVFTGGTYHIKTLKAKKKKDAQFAPGDYFIDTLDWDNENDIVISPVGVVRIFIKTLLDVKDKANFNVGGAAENLQIYLYDGAVADFNNKNVVNGLIYGGSGSAIEFKDDTNLTGAIISDGSVTIHKNLTLTYTAAMQTAIGSVDTCNAVDNFLIDIGVASASTCAPKDVTITARDSGNNPILDYSGTVDISTSTNHGDWTLAPGSSGTLNNLVADDGVATYLFDAADNGVVTLRLSNSHADDVTITVVDSTVPTSSRTSALINFRDNVFVIASIDSLGATAVAARGHALRAELWDRDLSTGNCAIDTKYTGSKDLDAWYIADVDHPAGASVPTISSGTPPASCGGSPVLALGPSAPAVNPTLNNLNAVPFVNGVWNFCLTTSDVGKFTINLRDDTRAYATGVDITGASNTLTVRPFGLAITGVQKGVTPNPVGTATSGLKFIPAGHTMQAAATFEVTAGGYLWNVADDGNNDGVPDGGANITDNGLAPRFAWLTTLSAANTAPYFTPVGGALGTLTGTTSVATGSYSGGQATVTDLAYSEVGSIQMQVALTNYLNSGGVNLSGVNVNAAGASTQIGRFYPDHFTLLPASSLTAACLSGGFTYMGQSGLGISFTVEARNTADVRTDNYGAGYSVGTVSMAAENNDDGVDLSARLTVSSSTWATGAYTVNTGTANFSRAVAPDGPYELLQLGIEVFDADLAVLAGRDMNPGTVGACGGACTAKLLIGNTKMRFGRLRTDNVSGVTRLGLPLRIKAQYYTPFGFVTNGDDNCTSFSGTDIAMAFVGGTNLAACDTAGAPSGVVTLVNGQTTSGLQLAAPGIGNDGSADLTFNLGAASGNTCTAVGGPTSAATSANLDFLQGNWGGAAAWDQDPGARATFGIYNNAAEFLYLQENY